MREGLCSVENELVKLPVTGVHAIKGIWLLHRVEGFALHCTNTQSPAVVSASGSCGHCQACYASEVKFTSDVHSFAVSALTSLASFIKQMLCCCALSPQIHSSPWCQTTPLRQLQLHQPMLDPPALQAALLQVAPRPLVGSTVVCHFLQAAVPLASRVGLLHVSKGFEAVTGLRVEIGMRHSAAWAELAPRAAAEAGPAAGGRPRGVPGAGPDPKGAGLV